MGRSGQGLAGVHDYICIRTRTRKAWLFIAHPPRPFSSVDTGDYYWVKYDMPTCQKEKGPANQKLRMRRPTNQMADLLDMILLSHPVLGENSASKPPP